MYIYIYIYMLFTGCEVQMRKTVPDDLKTVQARRARDVFKTARAQFFSFGPLLPVNTVFIF
jgi:hypothetical protein